MADLPPTVPFSTPDGRLRICPQCGTRNEEAHAYCPECGARLQADAPQNQQQDSRIDRRNEGVSSPRLAEPAKGPGVGKRAETTASEPERCPSCNHPVVEGSEFCHKCGASLSSAQTVAIASVRLQSRPRLLLVVEGEEVGEEYELLEDTMIGRLKGDITFPHDDYMSGKHAQISKRKNKYVLNDQGSRNGTFIKLKGEVELEPGDMILIGKQILKFVQ